jgi:ABC-type spermidine/putrescine transport system permease subunit II
LVSRRHWRSIALTFPGKALFSRLVLLPLILPGIITGLSLLMLFRRQAR